jgi:hypothetical protein
LISSLPLEIICPNFEEMELFIANLTVVMKTYSLAREIKTLMLGASWYGGLAYVV